MAKRLSIPSKELQLVIVGPKDYFKASRVQRLSINTDIPSTTIDEIGSASHAGEAKDQASVTLTFSAFDVGTKIFSVLTGTDMTSAYPGTGVDIGEFGEVDAILYTKSDSVADYSKSIHGKRLAVRDFSFSYSVDGEATEDYTCVGSEKRLFAYDVVVDKFTTGTTSFTLTQTPIQLKNGNNALSVILDGGYLTEVTAAPATGEYRLVGTTLTTGDSRTAQVLVVYHANPAGTNWTDVSDPVLPAAIRGRDVKISLSANSIARVQNVTINGSMNSTPVRELGSRGIVGYQTQVPTIEGTITVLDTDTELMNIFTNGTTATSGVVEWAPGEGCVTSGISLSIQLLDPCDDTSPYTVLKELYLDNIVIVGDATSVNVNGDTQLAVNWKSTTAHLVVYSGAKP
jgi:hypothetical protein